MKIVVWHDPRYGPAFAATLPGEGELPQTARIPQKLPRGPAAQFGAKGRDVSWERWAEHLMDRLPYGGWWTIEEVPDGTSIHDALSQVRRDAADL